MLRRRHRTPPPDSDGSSADSESVLTLDGVEVRRGSRVALRDVTFTLDPGTLTAVVGPNGAGKSSLFGVLSGRLPVARGRLKVGGAVAEVLQNTAVDSQLALTVDDVVRLGRYPARGFLRPMRAVDRRIIEEALAVTGLKELRRRSINELSGGQRQRALVAQGLAQQAPVLLLDEPTAGLDCRSQRQVLDIARAEADRGTTVLFVTHSIDEALEADNLIVLACDCLCCAPPPAALADPAVSALLDTAPRRVWNTIVADDDSRSLVANREQLA